MDVVNCLDKDHVKLINLLRKLQKEVSPRLRQKQFEVIKLELYLHEQVEKLAIYPLLECKEKFDILKAYEEHHIINLLINDIGNNAYDDERWQAKLGTLIDNLTHHIKEEREKIFPLTRRLIDESIRIDMANKIQKIKIKLKNDIKAAPFHMV